jgi:hypothetical protein
VVCLRAVCARKSQHEGAANHAQSHLAHAPPCLLLCPPSPTDRVVLWAGDNHSGREYVLARLDNMWEDCCNVMWVEVTWYYFPEELHCGRLGFCVCSRACLRACQTRTVHILIPARAPVSAGTTPARSRHASGLHGCMVALERRERMSYAGACASSRASPFASPPLLCLHIRTCLTHAPVDAH